MISGLFSRLAILSFGTLYPAYASFKAVRSKDVQEYVKWMMYWIVFAIFTCIETFTDLFLPWFPFYYEIKVVLVLWLLSPATNGSSILYRKFVHPLLKRKEADIDECIVRVREQGYATLLDLGTKAVNSVSNFVLETVQRNYRATGGAQRAVLSASQSHGSLSGQRTIVDHDQRLPVSRTRSLQTLRNIPAAALLTVEENDEAQQAELELRELQQQLEAHVNMRSSKTVLKKVATTASGKRAKRQ